MIKRTITLLVVLLLAACGGNATSSSQPVATTPTTVIEPTTAPIVIWSGNHPTIQMELIATITSNSTPLGEVRGVAVDQEGNLFVVDSVNLRVLKFDRSGKFLMEWGSEGSGDGQFDMSGDGYYRTGFVAVDTQGKVYVTENNRVQKFDNNGNFLTKWGTQGTGDGQFTRIQGIAIDRQNSVYLVDVDNNVVQKFNENGKFLIKWGEKGSGEGQFMNPVAVAIDTQGNILVADGQTGQLQKFDSNGKFLSQVFLGAVDGMVIGAAALAVGNEGQIYIGEYARGRVVVFDSSGKLLAAWGNTGTYEEQMSDAGGLALDIDGAVYVADTFNHRVLKFRQH